MNPMNRNMIAAAIKLRIKEWRYLAHGKINFFQALASMPPEYMRSKTPTEVKLFGKPYKLPLVNVGFFVELIDQIIEKNQYHIELIGKNATVIDAGANLGVFSIFAAVTRPDATIYAFEPTPATFAILENNVKWYPNIKAMNCALGANEGTASLVIVGHGGGVENHIGKVGLPVSMKTIDSFNMKVDFIKIDTEGYEAEIIKGAKETIKKWRPILAMSAYHNPNDRNDLPALLNKIAPYDCELRHDAEEDLICRPGPKTDRQFPFASVVVCTFNRSDQLRQCLESLERQTYPKDRYEVIVVDDASADDTSQVAQELGAHVIRRAVNGGVARARNAGIAASKGDIVAYIDDDAVADPHWLEYLITSLTSPTIAASGGKILARKTDHFTERYLSAIGCGNPNARAFDESKSLFWRFWAYIKNMFAPVSATTQSVEVQAVFGANIAYRKSELFAIGNFDESLRYDEDSDVSARLRDKGARIVFTPNAVIYHSHRKSIKKLIRQTYYNAENTLRFYSKGKKTLPIFPFPLVYLFALPVLLALLPKVGVLFMVFGPLILYCWWPIRALRERKLEYLAYGHIQLAIELATILGLARAKMLELKAGANPIRT